MMPVSSESFLLTSRYLSGKVTDQFRISDCNNSASQKWTISRGSTTVKLAGTNFCLDAGNNPANGAQAKVYTVRILSGNSTFIRGCRLHRPQCYAGLAAQTWYWTDDNRIAVQGKGQCLDLTSTSTLPGPRLAVC